MSQNIFWLLIVFTCIRICFIRLGVYLNSIFHNLQFFASQRHLSYQIDKEITHLISLISYLSYSVFAQITTMIISRNWSIPAKKRFSTIKSWSRYISLYYFKININEWKKLDLSSSLKQRFFKRWESYSSFSIIVSQN